MWETELSKANEIVICGAGAVANMTYLYLCECGYGNKIRCFAVSKKDNNPVKKNGLEVREIAKLPDRESGVLYVIATQPVVQDEIVNELIRSGPVSFVKVDADILADEFYEKYHRNPIEKKKILFSNMKGLGYGGNPKYIAEALFSLDIRRELDLVWVVSEKTKGHFPKGIRTVTEGTAAYYKELATAHVWIDNVRKGADVKKREGQYYIQSWHGAAPMKRVEMDAMESLPATYVENAKRDSQMADLFLSGSKFYTSLYRRAFWYEGAIMQVGLPRHDVFWNTKGIKEKVVKYFGLSAEAAIVVYAPTFRANFSMNVYDMNIGAVRESLEKRFNRKFVFLVGKHPNNRHLQYQFPFDERCIDVGEYEDFQEILAAADVLITDYSGCAYDFSFTGRPIFLYQPDFEKYTVERDFYVPVSEMPYISAETNGELVEAIAKFDDNEYGFNLTKYMNRFENYDKGCAAEKVAEHILNIVGD